MTEAVKKVERLITTLSDDEVCEVFENLRDHMIVEGIGEPGEDIASFFGGSYFTKVGDDGHTQAERDEIHEILRHRLTDDVSKEHGATPEFFASLRAEVDDLIHNENRHG